MKVKSESEVAQSCLTLSDPMACSLTGSSIHGISRQEYWSGVPLPSLTHTPNQPQRLSQMVSSQISYSFFSLPENPSPQDVLFSPDNNAL